MPVDLFVNTFTGCVVEGEATPVKGKLIDSLTLSTLKRTNSCLKLRGENREHNEMKEEGQ